MNPTFNGHEGPRPILCIEDDNEHRQMVTSALHGYDVISVASKHGALECLLTDRFSLVIIDHGLIDGTGEEVCRHLRVFDKRTPVLFINEPGHFSEAKAVGIGAQGSLEKSRVNFVNSLRERVGELVPMNN